MRFVRCCLISRFQSFSIQRRQAFSSSQFSSGHLRKNRVRSLRGTKKKELKLLIARCSHGDFIVIVEETLNVTVFRVIIIDEKRA